MQNRKRILLEEYEKIYDDINRFYTKDKLKLKDCCKKAKISPTKYYRICKTLNYETTVRQTNYQPKKYIKKNQYGGNINKYNLVNNKKENFFSDNIVIKENNNEKNNDFIYDSELKKKAVYINNLYDKKVAK